MELKMRINKIISSAQTLGIFDVSDESKVRIVVEDAGAPNTLEVRGRLYGQKNFTLLKTISGTASEVVNVLTYEELQIECTVYSSTGTEVRILAASFNDAGGSTIENIDVPSGDDLTDLSSLSFTSADSSVTITGDNVAKSIDFSVSASGSSYSPTTPADWDAPAPTTVGEGLDQLADRVTSAEVDISNKIDVSEKGAANGVAPLNGSSKIDSTYLPSYVDDIEEYANLASFPLTGETGKIYLALDTNLIYRWSGSSYVQVSESAVLSVNTKVGVVVLDKTDIGLGNVDNTSDLNKPISTATQTALNLKVDKAGDTMTGPLNMSAVGENIQFSVYGLNASSGIEIRSDDQTVDNSGNVKLITGDVQGADNAGSIYLTGGGNVDGNPANIILEAGISSGLGVNGSIVLDSAQVVYLNQNPLGQVDAVNHKIINVSDPVSAQDAATKKWVEDMSAIDNVLFVSPSASLFGADGSLYRPYVTIAAALAVASNNQVIALLPGTYSESTVIIPNTLDYIVIRGTSEGSTIVTNGFSFTTGSNGVGVLIEKVNVGTFTLDAGLAANGLLNFKQASLSFDRIDNNLSTLAVFTESIFFGGNLDGATHNFNETLIVGSINLNAGSCIFENCKFVSLVEAYGTSSVRILDCSLFGAPAFVNGNIVGIDSPTIQIDPASDALGSLTGFFTKTLLANIPLSNLTQSSATIGQSPVWNGTSWVAANVDSYDVNYTMGNPLVWNNAVYNVGAALNELATVTDSLDTVNTEFYQLFADMKEPTGFVNRTDSVMTFDNGTRKLTLQPAVTEYSIYQSGVISVINFNLEVTIPNISGSYYIYIDNSGNLVYTTTFNLSIITTDVYCAYIYWSASDGAAVIFGDERHGITMDGTTHAYLHTTRGTQLVSGASIGYTIGGDTISLSDMQIKDEDITANINNDPAPSSAFEQILSPTAYIPIIYREGASEWRKWTATSHPMVLQPGDIRASYNENVGGIWQLTEAPSNNKVLVTYIFATTSITEPVVALLGQSQYNNIDEARGSASWDQISFGDLPSPEMKLLYTIYYATSSGFASAVKSEISHVSDLRFTHDREVSATVFNSDHANLSGLTIGDDHPQYHNDTRGDIRYYTKTQIDTDVIKKAGTTAFTGDQSMGGNKLTNLANPVALTDAVNLQTLNSALGSSGDIFEKSFTLVNNQPVATDITDFVFPNAVVRSFEAIVSVSIVATSNVYETFEVRGIQKASDWFISITSEGDNSQVVLSITSLGQMQYITANYPGFVSGVLKFRAITTSV